MLSTVWRHALCSVCRTLVFRDDTQDLYSQHWRGLCSDCLYCSSCRSPSESSTGTFPRRRAWDRQSHWFKHRYISRFISHESVNSPSVSVTIHADAKQSLQRTWHIIWSDCLHMSAFEICIFTFSHFVMCIRSVCFLFQIYPFSFFYIILAHQL